MKRLSIAISIVSTLLLMGSVNARAQVSAEGPLGFVNTDDGDNGITGGMGGEVVRVKTVDDFRKAVADDVPRTVILEGVLNGEGVNRVKKCFFSVGSNKTIVGAGADAELHGWGLDMNGKHNIIIRNLRIFDGTPDAIACRETHHVWVDHCDIASEYDTSKEDWDGLLDFTIGSSYLTASWNRFHDHDKTSVCGSGTQHFEDNGKLRVTYHHNSFIHTNQRNPRIGYGRGHVFNNYYKDNNSYCIGYYCHSKVVSENNWFETTAKDPFNQMYPDGNISKYASPLDNAFYAELGEEGSHFGKALSTSADHRPTGTDFDPADCYGYDFALDAAEAGKQSVLSGAGPRAGLEREPILWPGNGMKYVRRGTPLRWSGVENVAKQTLFFGTSPEDMKTVDGAVSGYEPALDPSTTYYWCVKTSFTDYADVTTPVYQFRTADAEAAVPWPADGEEKAQLRAPTAELSPCTPMTLTWKPSFDARKYIVSLTPEGGETVTAEVNEPKWNPGTLLYGKKYTWNVETVLPDGTSAFSQDWTFSAPAREIKEGRNEVESLALSGLAFLEYSDGAWYKSSGNWATVGEAGPGAMTGVWAGPDAMVTFALTFWNETSGQAGMAVSVNDRKVDSWVGDKKSYAMVTHTVAEQTELHPGDQIRVDFHTQSKMRCRIDYLTATVNSLISGISGVYDVRQDDGAWYTLSGTRVTRPAKSGVYIHNGRKVRL